MEAKTAKQLRAIAKESGLKKANLIKFIEQYLTNDLIGFDGKIVVTPQPIKKRGGTLLDEEFEFDAPILVPEKRKIQKKQIPQVIEENVETFSDWLNWLENVEDESVRRKVDPKVERLKKQIENLWENVEDYEIVKIFSKSNKKFQSFFDTFKVKIINPRAIIDIDILLLEIGLKVIKERGLQNGDKIRWILTHPSWQKPVSTKLITITGDLDTDLVEEIAKFIEYKEVPLSEVKIEIQSIMVPRGKGRLTVTKDNVSRKRSVITIKNSDSICLARAIVTAVANINKDRWTTTQLKNGFNKSRKLQETEAKKLHEEAEVPISLFGSTLEDVKRFSDHLKVEINILDADRFNEIILTTGTSYDKIYLLKNQNHYDVITSMPGFLCKDYYCHTCKKTYEQRDKHRCPAKCIACFKYFPDGKKCSKPEIICDKCNRSFFGLECFEEHKRDRSEGGEPDIVCEIVAKCLECERTITMPLKDHICGYSKCSNCKDYCDLTMHKCFMKKKKCKGGKCTGCDEETKTKCYSCSTYSEKYMFYDFECVQETGIHEVNLAVVQDFEGNEWIFHTIDEFCKFVFEDDEKKNRKGYTFIAHNSKGYDAQFILKWCVENSVKPDVIYAGTKIMSLEVKSFGIKFIDSLNFVQMRLASFPKTFGLKELKKGYFPHYFNKKCNQNYVGPIPSKKHYGYDQMKEDERKSFHEWYNTRVKENYVFDFQKELIEYCRSDVDILRRSMMLFREEFIELENIDPLQYVTIAGVCMTIFRSNYLKSKKITDEDTKKTHSKTSIAVVKDTTRQENYSKISIAWLDYLSQKHRIKIQHALNGGEKKLECLKGKLRIDGFCEATNTVYEFQGCFWHGCKKCFDSDTINSKNQIDMRTLHRRTMEKNNKITSAGYNLVEIYECDLLRNTKFKSFMQSNSHDVVEPLNPRDAFFGGRTNITKLTYDFKKNESAAGGYVDFVSLYPTVQFFEKYPCGHPTKIFNPKRFDENWFGFIKCKVNPPRGLYHPVLPQKILCGKSKKLLFPLCRTCAETKQQECYHLKSERSFIGTWCTNEMQKALEKGYKIEKIYEVWHFPETSCDLFKGYVSKFMKIKMESSELKTGPGFKYESEEQFKKIVLERLGIYLESMKFNPGRRAIAKMCLNSLWGKFGQRNNMKQHKYVTEPKEFYEILLDDNIDNLFIQFLTEDMVQMTYDLKDQFVDNSNDTNIFIAAFTTSHARLKLYGVLDTLGEQVLGFDTDSAWFVQRPGGKTIETGDMLGELTDELGGDEIVKWCGTGPKSYSYVTAEGKITCKVKGFTLNHENSQYLNMKGMKQIINRQKERITLVNEQKITRDPKTKEIFNQYQEKDFRFVYDKRCLNKVETGLDTLPYGYTKLLRFVE